MIKFLKQSLRVFHCRTLMGENTCKLYNFRETIQCLTFCCVSWKETASFLSFTLECSFWMAFAVQPTVAPYLISTCCFSSLKRIVIVADFMSWLPEGWEGSCNSYSWSAETVWLPMVPNEQHMTQCRELARLTNPVFLNSRLTCNGNAEKDWEC